MAADGTVTPLTADGKEKLMAKVDELSKQALRVLAIATRTMGPNLPFGDEADGRGLHSFTFQLNFSRVCHKKTPYTP
jgi:magnesium-transporting ATPase (P-type)